MIASIYKKRVRVLILTDLHWNPASRNVSWKDILSLKTEPVIPKKERFLKIIEYVEIINTHNPSLILFGGDITADGSCGQGYYKAFLYLLHYIENRKISSVFIKGNHDRDYDKLVRNSLDLKFTRELSGKFIRIKGLRILGLSFDDTNKKSRLLELIAKNGEYDIVLAHAELTRRPWLFDFETKYIVTGHYDVKFNMINNKMFLSFFNDYPDRNYALIDFNGQKELIHYYLKPGYIMNGIPASEILIQGKRENNHFSFLNRPDEIPYKLYPRYYENDLMGLEFKKGFEEILDVKKKLSANSIKLTKLELRKLTQFKVNRYMKISKTLILDYIGNSQVEAD